MRKHLKKISKIVIALIGGIGIAHYLSFNFYPKLVRPIIYYNYYTGPTMNWLMDCITIILGFVLPLLLGGLWVGLIIKVRIHLFGILLGILYTADLLRYVIITSEGWWLMYVPFVIGIGMPLFVLLVILGAHLGRRMSRCKLTLR